MEGPLSKLQRGYVFLNYKLTDPRTQHVPLIMRPFTVLALVAAYVLFVKRIGPYLMRDQKPFNLRRVLVVYNLAQIIMNAYGFAIGCTFWFSGQYNWRCQPIETADSPRSEEMVTLAKLYFWLKIIDMLDTVFFVLRKKDKQITFLHVYHHGAMVVLGWAGVKYFAGGHGTLLGLVNTFVHCIMYTYYLVSTIYPGTIWWKKLITQIQLAQHITLLIHLSQLLFHNPCGYPKIAPFVMVPQYLFMIVMFLRFYHNTYGRKASSKKVD